jgi:hypothetical protein
MTPAENWMSEESIRPRSTTNRNLARRIEGTAGKIGLVPGGIVPPRPGRGVGAPRVRVTALPPERLARRGSRRRRQPLPIFWFFSHLGFDSPESGARVFLPGARPHTLRTGPGFKMRAGLVALVVMIILQRE